MRPRCRMTAAILAAASFDAEHASVAAARAELSRDPGRLHEARAQLPRAGRQALKQLTATVRCCWAVVAVRRPPLARESTTAGLLRDTGLTNPHGSLAAMKAQTA